MTSYYVQVQVSSEFLTMSAIDAVSLVEGALRDRLREMHGDEIGERGRVVWTARLEVPALPTERNDR